MTKTLASGVRSASVDFEILHKNYHPMLALVKEMIGVIPNCDPILEIWPTGFRTYNLLVPNLFNLPNTVFRKKSFKATVGLAMYTSSRAAACPYCSAHTCSFALRRGATVETIKGVRSPEEQAVVALAEGLSTIPAHLTPDDCKKLEKYFTRSDIEWLALAVSMMGFLNKFMDAMGIELEQESLNDTADILMQTGWTPGKHVNGEYRVNKVIPEQDNLFTYLRVIRQAPGAVMLEKKWTTKVPSKYEEVSEFLKQHTGYSFPLLKPITKSRVIRAITTVLRDNLDKDTSKIGMKSKMIAGYIFTKVVSNPALSEEIRNLSSHITPELNEVNFNNLEKLSKVVIPTDSLGCGNAIDLFHRQLDITEKQAAVALLALSASPSPAQVNEAVIASITKYLDPPEIVETIVWLSVLQLLHRLNTYYSTLQTLNAKP